MVSRKRYGIKVEGNANDEIGSRDPNAAREEPWLGVHPSTGFAGISRRLGKKPIIAAVNGFALGGGFEIVLNW